MSLAPGTRLGPYAVVAKLGDGGMGEVYRGTDTRLGRDVAIKVVSATTQSPDAFARFEREGRAIAALNHPNICTLHDVGASDGHPYLVMELLAGATLHQVLAAGPLPIPTLVDHAIALADALHAAHARGIIHRDLKPANVFLTDHGTIKILDFGLAKADSDRRDETRMVEGAITGPGTTLGTLAYMSPEQVRGSALDARTDLFSLGLVLYEMATGRRAFTGKTFAEVSASILRDDPPSPLSVRADLPPKLEEIILKTLEKDRDLRYQSAADLRGDLKRLKRTERSEAAPASSPRSAATLPPPSSSDAALAVGLARRHPLAIAGVALLVASAAVATWWTTVRDRATSSATTPEVTLQPLTLDGQAGHATISPDGRFIAYVRRSGARSSVVVKQLTSNSDVVIMAPAEGSGYYAPSVTPDGGYVDVLVLRPSESALVRIPFLGGTPRTIVDGAVSGVGWSPDGQRMAFMRYAPNTQETSLVVSDAQGRNEHVLVTRRAPSFFHMTRFDSRPPARPSWSADGRWIALAGLNNSPERLRDNGELIEVDAASGAERAVRRVDGVVSELAYLDNDRLAVSFINPVSQEPGQWRLYPRTGAPVPLTRDLNNIQDVQLTADRTSGVATRTTTRLSISIGTIATGVFSEVVGESGLRPAAAALDSRGNLLYTARVPGGRAVFRSDGAVGAGTMVVSDLVGALPSPDGTFIVGHRPEVGLVRVNADGSSAAVISQDASAAPRAITPDGSAVICVSNKSGHQQPWLVPLAGGDARRLADVYIDGTLLWLSSDGRQVIFRNNAATQICAFPGFDQCRAEKVLPGPFSADGKTVFAVDRTDPTNIFAQPLDGGPRTPVTRFTDKVIQDFSLSPDGTRIAVTRTARESDVVLVKGLK